MKFLIIGGSGLVGKSLIQELKNSPHTFIASYNKNTPAEYALKCDILSKEDLEQAFETAKPDVVINATNLAGGVDFCENNPELAENFHYNANVNIGELCKKHHAKMVLISTDYVFDGSTPPYSEEDKVNPLNKYGQYKLMAEQWMQKNLTNYIIARTTNVFGWDPYTKTPNFLMGVYFKLIENQTTNAPSFLSGNPTHVSSLTKAIIELSEKNASGIYNVVGKSFLNRYEWACKFCDVVGLNKELLIDIKNPPQNIVPRPLKSNLSITKFTGSFNTTLADVDEGLNLFLIERKNRG